MKTELNATPPTSHHHYTIGIIGGGQLARMMILAGIPLGLRFIILDPHEAACAGQLCQHIIAPYDDPVALQQLAQQVDLITFDFENVPTHHLHALTVPIYPPIHALATAQDRFHEKTLFRDLAIPTPAFYCIESLKDLSAALEQTGFPAVLKTRRFGYDGKGQYVIHHTDQQSEAFTQLGEKALILEAFVPFDQEISLIAARNHNGDIIYYPLTRNHHHHGILDHSLAPIDSTFEAIAQTYINKLLTTLNYVGVLALELFVCNDQVLANEIAPRVHNSGHWTIEGATTSQFENHLRAILNWPLGSSTCRYHAAMLNFIGQLPDKNLFLAHDNVHFHDYGKSARKGRKVGHVTLCATSHQALLEKLTTLQKLSS